MTPPPLFDWPQGSQNSCLNGQWLLEKFYNTIQKQKIPSPAASRQRRTENIRSLGAWFGKASQPQRTLAKNSQETWIFSRQKEVGG